jgi:hypothetical protein
LTEGFYVRVLRALNPLIKLPSAIQENAGDHQYSRTAKKQQHDQESFHSESVIRGREAARYSFSVANVTTTTVVFLRSWLSFIAFAHVLVNHIVRTSQQIQTVATKSPIARGQSKSIWLISAEFAADASRAGCRKFLIAEDQRYCLPCHCRACTKSRLAGMTRGAASKTDCERI